jgi:hypothetical protein
MAKVKEFIIPADQIVDFAEVLADSGLENEIAGKMDDDSIIISVYYEVSERPQLYEVWEWFDDNVEEDED